MAPIDDDPYGGRDFGEPEPGPSWFDCPMLPRRDMLGIIERCKDLDGRSVNLFRTAFQGKPGSGLFVRGGHLLGLSVSFARCRCNRRSGLMRLEAFVRAFLVHAIQYFRNIYRRK